MTIDEGWITWEDREPTPDPEEVLKEALARIEEKLDNLTKQVAEIKEGMSKPLEEKSKAGGSKASKKPKKAKGLSGIGCSVVIRYTTKSTYLRFVHKSTWNWFFRSTTCSTL